MASSQVIRRTKNQRETLQIIGLSRAEAAEIVGRLTAKLADVRLNRFESIGAVCSVGLSDLGGDSAHIRRRVIFTVAERS